MGYLKKILMLAGVAIAAMSLPAGCAQVNRSTAANMGNNCFSCHGPEGMSPGSIPSLSGRSESFITKTMMEFKQGKRRSTVMERHAKGYTNAEIKAIAKYIAGLEGGADE